MKKIVCLSLVAVLLFTLSFSCFAASGVVISYAKDAVLSFVSSTILSYSNSIQQRTEAARGAYFNYIVEDKLCSGLTIFDSSGKKFTDDILEYYFNYYLEAVTGTSDYYDSDYDVFIQAAGFPNTPFSLRLLSFYFSYDTSSDSIKSEFISSSKTLFKNYYNSFLARYLIAQGENATDPNPGKSGLEIAPGYVSGSDLKDAVSADNEKFFPKNATGKMSYRTDKQFYNRATFQNYTNLDYTPTFVYDNVISAVGDTDEIYFIPWYFDGEKNYYGNTQFRLYFTYETKGSSEKYKYLNLEYWDMFDGSRDNSVVINGNSNFINYPYISLQFFQSPYGIRFYCSNSLKTFLNSRFGSSGLALFSFAIDNSDPYDLFSSDKVTSLSWLSMLGHFKGYEHSCTNNDDDVGYIASSAPITTQYNIDTTKIPDDAIITVVGDNVYNYYITNPETGDSSKFGDYITNNYTYITNNYGGSESGGSSVSGVAGNVTVGGSIDVGGSVGVDINVNVPDININVNGNGGAGGSGSSISNPDDFTSADEVDLTKYYDEAVEQSSGFQKFLKDFFGFLPPELLGLILFAVAMAIVCRVFGR